VQDLVEFRSGAQKLENIGDPDSHPAYARPAPALLGIESNAVEMTGSHRILN
jgi:hypothetical protein